MKKKIFSIALVACIVILSIAGASVAYFTDTDDVTNVFTVGNVDIQLTEAKVMTDGNGWHIVAVDPEERVASTDMDYKEIRTLWPGQTVHKDPTIENIGSEKAYVGAKITLSGASSLLANEEAVLAFLSGGALAESNNTVVYTTDGSDVVVYVVIATALDDANDTDPDAVKEVMLFETVVIPAGWNNAQMARLEDFSIKVEAFATQEAGFANADAALAAAFPDVFDF